MKHHWLYTATAVVTLAFSPLPAQAQTLDPLAKVRMAGTAPMKIKMNVLFIYDSSGSMWGHQDGQPKVELGREVLNTVMAGLPPDANLGLIAYGHRQKNACSDIELLAPIGSKTPAELKELVGKLRPNGITPLSDALATAADAFKGVEGAKMIVLITDGAEECSGDPCEVTRKLALSGLVVRVNVVGFSLSAKESAQLQCIAREGTGRYFDVKNRETLTTTIKEITHDIKTYVPPPPQKPPLRTDFTTTMPPIEDVPALKPIAPRTDLTNLLSPANGGKMVKADNPRFEASIGDAQNASAWVIAGQEAVFAFKGGKPATISQFELSIPASAPQNVQDFELMASNDSVAGPYFMLGRYSADNLPGTQHFTFSETTARYVKLRVVSNYGYAMQGWGNTQLHQLRLLGKQP